MKTLRYSIIALFIAAFFTGCTLEPVDQNLEGEWNCTETSEIFLKTTSELKGTSIFPVYIAQDAVNSNKYYIDNFYQLGSGNQVEIEVNSDNTITIQKQSVSGIEVQGSGTINSAYNFIDLTYTADDGGEQIDHVTAEYSKN